MRNAREACAVRGCNNRARGGDCVCGPHREAAFRGEPLEFRRPRSGVGSLGVAPPEMPAPGETAERDVWQVQERATANPWLVAGRTPEPRLLVALAELVELEPGSAARLDDLIAAATYRREVIHGQG